ncbi:DNA-methyltransferase [Geodermatophilus sp. SYSU D00525]
MIADREAGHRLATTMIGVLLESQRPLPDIKPQTPVSALDRDAFGKTDGSFDIRLVGALVGMSPVFMRKVLGHSRQPDARDVLTLLDQDAYKETFVRRSQVLDYLLAQRVATVEDPLPTPDHFSLHKGNTLDLLRRLPAASVDCVVTSTPYWAMRIYKDSHFVRWADGEECPYGHEQTPEGFARHTTQLLYELLPSLANTASVWWNVMDSYNTRTQIRGNAAEALRAMQGHDKRSWADHECRRYSAGHAYLKDGEQCLIPGMIAERASRIGYYVKSVITWAKPHTLPEPQNSRVSRSLEYVLHLSKVRTPRFNRNAYRELPAKLGGRNSSAETDKLSDFWDTDEAVDRRDIEEAEVWKLYTSNGGKGHGAQFPVALPGRCIGLSTTLGDVVMDPFVGSGNSGVAALSLGRRFIGMDVSAQYLAQAERALALVDCIPLDQRRSAEVTDAALAVTQESEEVPVVAREAVVGPTAEEVLAVAPEAEEVPVVTAEADAEGECQVLAP